MITNKTNYVLTVFFYCILTQTKIANQLHFFLPRLISFRTTTVLFCFLFHQFDAKLTEYKKRYWVESLPEGQNTESLRASHSSVKENHGYRNTGFEVSPEDIFLQSTVTISKHRYEDIFVRCQSGFITHTGLPEH